MSDVLAWRGGERFAGYDEVDVPVEQDGQPQLGDSGQPKTRKSKRPRFEPLAELCAGQGEYEVPVSPQKGKRGAAFRWQYVAVSDDDYLREADDCASRLDSSRDWLGIVPRTEPPVIEPAMTPKRGHIAMQVSGGLLGTNLVKSPSGEALLLKGNVTKFTITRHDVIESEDDEDSMTRVQSEERFKTLLSTLDADGTLVTHEDPTEIGQLLERYVEQLAEIVQTRNVPQYDMKPEAWEWAVFEMLSRGRQLPGRTETGLTDFQKHLAIALGRLCMHHNAGFVNAEMGSGKAQPLHAQLLTPEGWIVMESVQAGDFVIGADGKPTKVLGVYPQGQKDIYRVTFTDGSWAECCDDHLWIVQKPLNKWKGKSAKTLALREIRALGLAHANGNLQHFIPLTRAVQFPERELPMDPYLLGVLLGDGSISSSSVGFTSHDDELVNNVKVALPNELILKLIADYTWHITSGKRGGPVANRQNAILSALREMHLMGCRSEVKFIPKQYRFASIAQRSALLQGLLDTDGYVRPHSCTIEYVTVSPTLADDVTFLVQSVGGTVTRRLKPSPKYRHNGEERIGQVAYRLFVALPNDIQPFRLSRKLADYKPRTKYQPSRAIQSIEFVGRMPAQCIKVAAEDGLYLTDNCVVTHNTTIGLAIAEYIHTAQTRQKKKSAYPALVVGPGIVTGKENWPKEVPEVTPDADSRVITIGARPLAKAMKIGAWLKEVVGLMLDDSEFEGLNTKESLALILKQARQQKKSLSVHLQAALRQSLTRAEKYPPNRRKGAQAPNPLDGRIGGFSWLGLEVPRDPENERTYASEYSVARFVEEYTEGILPEKTFAILSFETAKLASGRLPALNVAWRRVQVSDPEREATWVEVKRVCTCPHCGQTVAEKYDEITGEPDMATLIFPEEVEQFIGTKRRFCQAPVQYYDDRQGRYLAGKRVLDPETGKPVYRAKDENDQSFICGSALFEVSSLRRVAAAEYIKKKAKHVFGLCLVDEVHKSKSKGSGTGWVLTVLNNAARWTVGLTGTLFGGYSTSIFWLLYRLAAEVRHEFGFNDERRWTEKYGLLKRQFYVDKEPSEDGAFTGSKFFETVSEKPGISPAIAGVGLKYCTFSSLKDIGLPLPEYSEEIVRLKLTEAMLEQYEDADGSQTDPVSGLLKWALDTQKEEDGTGRGAISVWLNTALHRPDAMFRPEEVWFNRRLQGKGKWAVRRKEHIRSYSSASEAVLDHDSGELLHGWLPKEQWAADTCWNERQRNRKTLIYLKQTGERDIQPRVKAALESRGLRVGILKPSIAPEKRATWLKRHSESFDVLLTNARLVEVGLNLTMFSTAIFFELEYSLYTVWQAMRRLYRPGAPKPVKLYFPVYAGTLAEAALDLIGAKMMAAQCFYGDEVGGALVDEGDEGDLLNDLVRKALGQIEVGRAEGLFAIGNNQMASESPFGSPTAVSPLMRTLESLLARKGELINRPRSLRKVVAVPIDQMTLF